MLARTGSLRCASAGRGVWLPLAVALLIGGSAYGSAQAAGSTALEFLKMGVGARAVGMGEAYVSLADDASAVYWNPAGLAGQPGSELLFTHVEWFQDIRMENASCVWGGADQGLGVSVTLLHVGGLEERDADGRYLGEFRFFDYAFSLSYAREVVPSVRLGLTGKFLLEQIDRDQAKTAALDAGVVVALPWTGFQLGAAITNVGPGLKFVEEEDDLPLTVAAGASYRTSGLVPWVSGMTMAADVRHPRDGETSLRLGWEVGLGGLAHYRLGYATNLDNRDIGTGFGINFGEYNLDYAFVPSDYDLGDTHRFSLAWQF